MSFVCMEEQLCSLTSFKRQISPLGNNRLFIKSEPCRISVNMKQRGLQLSEVVPVSSELPHIVLRTLAAIWSRQPERRGSYFQSKDSGRVGGGELRGYISAGLWNLALLAYRIFGANPLLSNRRCEVEREEASISLWMLSRETMCVWARMLVHLFSAAA